MLKPEAKVFALEGNDGAGKTTQLARLKSELEKLGLRVHIPSSPGKTLVGRALKSNMSKILEGRKNALFTYDIRRTERQIPENTDVVLWDRHLDSIVISNGDGAAAEVDGLSQGIRRPDQVLFLDLPPEISWERESANTDHPISAEWLQTKYRRYQEQIAAHPAQYEVIDANQPLEVVYQALLGIILNEVRPQLEKNQQMVQLLMETPGVVRYELENPVEVKPGVFLPMFINLKDTWGNVPVREEVTQRLVELISDRADWIVGLESGGNYYAVSLANQLQKPVSLFRKNPKDYSLGGYFTGQVPPAGSRVAILDDVYATGTSGIKAVEQLKLAGCEVEFYSIYSYSTDQEMAQRLGVPATALAYFSAVRQASIDRGLLTPEEADEVTGLVDIYRSTVYS